LDAPTVGLVTCHSGFVQSHKKEKAFMSEVSIIGVDRKRPIVTACRVNPYSLNYCRYCRRY